MARNRRHRPRRLEQAFWSAHSRTWDEALAEEDVAAHVLALASWLAEAVAPGALVADLGCGTGNHAVALRAQGVDVVGIDVAPGMLARARLKRDAAGRGLSLVRADLHHGPPLAGASLGGVISVYSAQFLELAAFLGEVRRVLRPGGAVLVEVPRPGRRRPRGRPGRSRARRWAQRVNWLARIAGTRLGLVHLRTTEQLVAALSAAGFEPLGHRVSERAIAVLARG